MKEIRLVVICSEQEKNSIRVAASKYGFSISEYMRCKLFHENEDLAANAEKFICPPHEKNQFVNITVLYKIYFMAREVLRKLEKVSATEVAEADIQALEYARREREKYGYKLVKSGDE